MKTAGYATDMDGSIPETGLTALTIAGFDPSSGAGVTADLLVFAAHRVFGTAAITALTVQSTLGVRRTEAVDPALVAETLACLHADLPPDGVKVGMLGGAGQVEAVAAYLRTLRHRSPRTHIVLDPVIRSSSGAELLSPDGLQMLKNELLPLVDVITPNTEELSVLTGRLTKTDADVEAAAMHLVQQSPEMSVLATGGHRSVPDDLLLHEGRVIILRGERIATRATHGTGCAFSSALLCGLLNGFTMPEAALAAKAYVAQAMRSAMPRGAGNGPLDLLWPVLGHARG